MACDPLETCKPHRVADIVYKTRPIRSRKRTASVPISNWSVHTTLGERYLDAPITAKIAGFARNLAALARAVSHGGSVAYPRLGVTSCFESYLGRKVGVSG